MKKQRPRRTAWQQVLLNLGLVLLPLLALVLARALSPGAAGLALLLAAPPAFWLARRSSLAQEGAAAPLSAAEALGPAGDLPDQGQLAQLSQAVALLGQPEGLMDWLCRLLAETVKAGKCALILPHPEEAGRFQVQSSPLLRPAEMEELASWIAQAGPQLAEQRQALIHRPPDHSSPPNRLLPGEWESMLVPLPSGERPEAWVRLANGAGFEARDARQIEVVGQPLLPLLLQARAARALEERLEESALLVTVGSALAGTIEFDEAVSRSAEALQSLLGCEQVNLFLVDENNETLHLYQSIPYSDQEVEIPLGEGIIGRVAESGEPAGLSGEEISPDTWSTLPQLGSQLCAPLKLGNWVIGVVDAQSSRPRAFEERQVRLLYTVTGQLASLLQSSRLYQATRQRAAELSLLYDATVAISTAELDRSGIVELVMKRLIHAIQVDGGRLGLWDSSGKELVTHYGEGPTLQSAGKPTSAGRAVDAHYWRYFLTHRRPLTLYRDDRELDPTLAQAMEAQELQSLLILPLVTPNRVIGLMELTQKTPRRFNQDEIRLALTLATQASIAMENARLYQETKLAVEELTVLQAMALDITAQVALPELLDRLMSRAQHLVGAAGTVITLHDPQRQALSAAASQLPWKGAGRERVIQAAMALAQGVVTRGRTAVQPIGPLSLEANPASPALNLSCASVPLRWREEVVGVLSVLRDSHEEPFAAQQVYLLELLAPQAAITIRNVQLYEELEKGLRELEQAQAGLIEAEKAAAIGRLAASLAHEINNPLQSLNNCLHLSLRPDLTDKKRNSFLALAKEEVERLVVIVNRMLNFYRPSTSEVRSETDVNRLLNDVLILTNKQLEHRQVAVELNLDRGMSPIMAIPNNLRQVFLNMILNAADAMPDGGWLRISTRQVDAEWVEIIISDTGRGIPEENLSRIYEPFFTTKDLGTGLGLAISYGIVEAHHGRIRVESCVGQGTTFAIEFPIGADEAPAQEPGAGTARLAAG